MKLSSINYPGRMGIISNYRMDLSPEDNQRSYQKLYQILSKRGLNPTPITGIWRGKREPAFSVPDIDLDTLQELKRMFGQEAVVYRGPETNGKTELLGSH